MTTLREEPAKSAKPAKSARSAAAKVGKVGRKKVSGAFGVATGNDAAVASSIL